MANMSESPERKTQKPTGALLVRPQPEPPEATAGPQKQSAKPAGAETTKTKQRED